MIVDVKYIQFHSVGWVMLLCVLNPQVEKAWNLLQARIQQKKEETGFQP